MPTYVVTVKVFETQAGRSPQDAATAILRHLELANETRHATHERLASDGLLLGATTIAAEID